LKVLKKSKNKRHFAYFDVWIQGALLACNLPVLLLFNRPLVMCAFYIYPCIVYWQACSAVYVIRKPSLYPAYAVKAAKWLIAPLLSPLLVLAGISGQLFLLLFTCSCLSIIVYFLLTLRLVLVKPRRKTFMDII